MAKRSGGTVSLEKHFAVLREADQRAIELVREWTQERLDSHNNLLSKWQEATERDRRNYASREMLESLKQAFEIYKEITAKALALAEGKTKGFDTVRASVAFVGGLLVAGLSVWAVLK